MANLQIQLPLVCCPFWCHQGSKVRLCKPGSYKSDGLNFCKHSLLFCCHLADIREMQVKIRGNRVEPGEIEDKISRVEGVQRCVVIKREDDAKQEFLAAYMMLHGNVADRALMRVRVRDAVAAQCPYYMVPAAYVIMDQLPLTR